MLKDPAKVRESWHSVYGGSKNAGKVAVLEEGMKYQQIGIPRRKHSFGNAEVPDRRDRAAVPHPAHMVGDLTRAAFQHRAAVIGIREIYLRPVGDPVGAVHTESIVPSAGEERILL